MAEYLQYTLDSRVPWDVTEQVIASGGGPLRFGKAMDVEVGQLVALWYDERTAGMAPVIYMYTNDEDHPRVFYGAVVPVDGDVSVAIGVQGGAPSSARGGSYLPMRKDAVA